VYMFWVASYLDPLRDILIASGRMSTIEANKFYYILTFTAILAVGLITYFIINLLKYILNKF
ncbi:MAG: hypothetical protein J6P79_14930, partial [Pseudobutyrivibrio sp.]|nr:hypothetical protein [Pseudobutyrivibrio sp.]